MDANDESGVCVRAGSGSVGSGGSGGRGPSSEIGSGIDRPETRHQLGRSPEIVTNLNVMLTLALNLDVYGPFLAIVILPNFAVILPLLLRLLPPQRLPFLLLLLLPKPDLRQLVPPRAAWRGALPLCLARTALARRAGQVAPDLALATFDAGQTLGDRPRLGVAAFGRSRARGRWEDRGGRLGRGGERRGTGQNRRRAGAYRRGAERGRGSGERSALRSAIGLITWVFE